MDRRDFGRVLFAGAAGMAALPVGAEAKTIAGRGAGPSSRGLMGLKVIQNDKIRLGGQRSFGPGPVTSPQNMNWHKRWGIKHIEISLEDPRSAPSVVGVVEGQDRPPPAAAGGLPFGVGGRMRPTNRWNLEAMRQVRDTLQENGLEWEGIRMDSAYIAMKPGPERSRYLDVICDNVRSAGEAGVRFISYHWNLTPIRRNLELPGRGGSTYTSFKLEKDWQDLPLTSAGRVSSDDYWERLHTFVNTVVPVAIQSKVKMACHPYDPGGLPLGYLGVDNWDAGDYATALQRYEALYESPFNGFQYDTGVSRESMPTGQDQLQLLHGLLKRGKVHSIHFRNVRGGQNDFQEVYVDEGDIDMFNIVRLLRDMNWEGSLLADHSPDHPDDPRSYMGFAYANGYIQGLIRAAREEARAHNP